MGRHTSLGSEALLHGRGIAQPHRPAFWVFGALLVAGFVLTIPGLVSALFGVHLSSGLGIAGTVLFAAAGLWFITWLSDLDPKPASIIGAAFLGDAFVATAFSQIVSPPLMHAFGEVFSSQPVQNAFAAVRGEEFYKALVVVAVFLTAPWWWRRPLDGLVIGALVGLGFQVYEDIIYITGGATRGRRLADGVLRPGARCRSVQPRRVHGVLRDRAWLCGDGR